MPDKKGEFKVKVEVEEPASISENTKTSQNVTLPHGTSEQNTDSETKSPHEVQTQAAPANQPLIKPINLNNNSQKHSQTTQLVKDLDGNSSTLSITAIFISFLVSLAIGGLIIFGIFYYKGNFSGIQKNKLAEKTPIPLPTNEMTASPTAEPVQMDLEEVKIQVLNGSGVVGEAGYAKELLEDAGFDDIDTANARTYDHTETEISTYENMPGSVLDAITEALDEYDVVIRKDLDDNYQYDVVIILGER